MPAKPTHTKPIRLPGKLLPRSFFERPPEQVAPLLLGKLLVRKWDAGTVVGGRIVEVEAYLGPHNDPPDPAAHAHRGPTPRNQVLFGPAGHAYVYSIYGQYFCMNISCEVEGQAGCVLLRALEPVAGVEVMALNRGVAKVKNASGAKASVPLAAGSARRKSCPDTTCPGRGGETEIGFALRELTSGPSRLCQALGLTRAEHNGLDLLSPGLSLQVRDDGFVAHEYVVTPRIGIRHAVERPLRFALPGHVCVSGPKSLTGKRVFLG